MDELESLIKDKYTKVCICKSISRHTIKTTIREGAKSVIDIKRITRATTGSCHGDRCIIKIKELLESYGDSWN